MATISQEQAVTSISTHFYLTAFLLSMGSIVALGLVIASVIPAPLVATLAGFSIFVLIALLVIRFIKGLSILQLPLLIVACFVSGVMLSQLADGILHLTLISIALCVNFLLLLIGTQWLPFQFQKFNLLLAILAICFSFIGGMLIFIEGSPTIQLLWLSGAIFCLDLLLYTLVQHILQTQDQPVRPMFVGVVLLHIALAMNLLLGIPLILT